MSTLSIRLPNSIHQHTRKLAREEGVSINQFISSAVAEKLAALDTERYLAERARRGSKVNIRRILAKIPDVTPGEQDRLRGNVR
ncbi:CopG family transcriptional regulator [Opitutaceae bacterium TAV5]|nr:CopG family transcriptional regulator [Opitutaceae bacterium TAV5]